MWLPPRNLPQPFLLTSLPMGSASNSGRAVNARFQSALTITLKVPQCQDHPSKARPCSKCRAPPRKRTRPIPTSRPLGRASASGERGVASTRRVSSNTCAALGTGLRGPPLETRDLPALAPHDVTTNPPVGQVSETRERLSSNRRGMNPYPYRNSNNSNRTPPTDRRRGHAFVSGKLALAPSKGATLNTSRGRMSSMAQEVLADLALSRTLRHPRMGLRALATVTFLHRTQTKTPT